MRGGGGAGGGLNGAENLGHKLLLNAHVRAGEAISFPGWASAVA